MPQARGRQIELLPAQSPVFVGHASELSAEREAPRAPVETEAPRACASYALAVHSVGPTLWTSFSVGGERYYWTAYPSQQRVGDGPWEPIEFLTVSRRPDARGIATAHPVGTLITE